MHSFFAFVPLAIVLSTVFGAPTELKSVETVDGDKKPNSYIVTMKDDASPSVLAQNVQGEKTVFDPEFFNGFAAVLDEAELNKLRADPNVESIQEDAKVATSAAVSQVNAPWGLQRISQRGRITSGTANDLTFTYNYDSSAGAGVDVYVVDTGIYIEHTQFGGRATFGAVFGGYSPADENGHGTHVAGTVGSSQFGVAKAASLIAVKVLGADGTGFTSDVIAGLDYVRTQYRTTRRPTVVNLSLGSTSNRALDSAVNRLTDAGIHVVVAAGNQKQDVNNYSPARAFDVITVAASDFTDVFATFSNFGFGVDVIAPGVNVISTYIGSPTAMATLSGTSMAAPHVAGLVAYIIAKNGNMNPVDMGYYIRDRATSNAITSVPSGTLNKLANNDV